MVRCITVPLLRACGHQARNDVPAYLAGAAARFRWLTGAPRIPPFVWSCREPGISSPIRSCVMSICYFFTFVKGNQNIFRDNSGLPDKKQRAAAPGVQADLDVVSEEEARGNAPRQIGDSRCSG